MQTLKALQKGTQSFDSANRMRLITNLAADRLLIETPDVYKDSWPVWTRTIMAYPKAGEAFGHTLEYSCKPHRYILDTSQFRGERRTALLFEDFDLKLDNNTCIFVPKGKPIVLRDFPQESGWHSTNSYGIPLAIGTGDKRFLCRLEEARVGAVVRDFSSEGKLKLDVMAHHRPSLKMGAILEEPARSNVVRIDAALRK